MNQDTFRLAVLLSGAGSTMVNLHEHIERGEVPASIVVVVSSREGVQGLARARERGIATRVLTRKGFRTDGAFDEIAYSVAMRGLLEEHRPDLVVLAGFMTRLAAPLLERFSVVNVHPALLPMFGGHGFYGHRVHEAVLEAGVKVTGATVHFASADYDRGPIIMQEAVDVRDDDTPDTLAGRVQEAERRIYPKAIAAIAEGRVAAIGARIGIASDGGAR